MADVIQFTGSTTNNIDPDQVLTDAVGTLDTVLVLGWTKENTLYVATSDGSVGDTVLLMEIAKQAMLSEGLA